MCHRAYVCVCLLFAVSLGGCGSAAQRQAAATQIPRALPTPNASPEELGECGWEREAYAWVDTNTNGQPDAGERPLPKVAISAYFFGSSRPEEPFPRTNSNGHTRMLEMLWGCPEWRIEVTATPPEGYRLTTKQPIVSAYPTGEDPQPFLFGFVATE